MRVSVLLFGWLRFAGAACLCVLVLPASAAQRAADAVSDPATAAVERNAASAAAAPPPALSSTPQAAGEPLISDNSFLIEEAYNQERDVVQHISSFSRVWTTGSWAFTFTQEWPVNPAPRHQLSYTVAVVSPGEPGAGSGFGDLTLHYRYQLVQTERLAFAPRASLLLPTGDHARFRGMGGTGGEFNLPLSVRVADRVVTHWNAGGTVIPRARNHAGDTASAAGVRLGQSVVWEVRPRFNVLLETVYSRQQVVTGPDRRAWESSTIINPGFRWAHNFPSGLQIVPGLAFPVEIGSAGRGDWGVILYLSFEYLFAGRGRD